MNHEQELHRLVIVGGGVAGIELASVLGKRFGRAHPSEAAKLQVTLVDSDSAHVWKPMLHMIAAGTRDVSQQQTPYIAHARDSGFSYEPGEMVGLDRVAKEISLGPLLATSGQQLRPGRLIGYDTLIIAVGSQANDFGTPGVAEHCSMIDSRKQANAFNDEVRLRIAKSQIDNDDLSIAIVGGGATGVELAAALVQLANESAGYGATGLPERLTITLIESGPRLLAAFPQDISTVTLSRLEQLGVQVMTGAKVIAVEPDAFVMKGSNRLHASIKVWAAGVKGPTFLANLDGLESGRNNQLIVTPGLRSTRDDRIFAVGDCASVTPKHADRALPPTAQMAHQQALHLIRHLPANILQGVPVPDFQPRDMGALVSLGEYDAFGSLGKFGLFNGTTVKGRIAQFGHAMLYRSHQARLHGFWRGGLLWMIDLLNSRVRPGIRLD